jgi:hypothetical protein
MVLRELLRKPPQDSPDTPASASPLRHPAPSSSLNASSTASQPHVPQYRSITNSPTATVNTTSALTHTARSLSHHPRRARARQLSEQYLDVDRDGSNTLPHTSHRRFAKSALTSADDSLTPIPRFSESVPLADSLISAVSATLRESPKVFSRESAIPSFLYSPVITPANRAARLSSSHSSITATPPRTTVRGRANFPSRIFSALSHPHNHHALIAPQNIHRTGRSTDQPLSIGLICTEIFPQKFSTHRKRDGRIAGSAEVTVPRGLTGASPVLGGHHSRYDPVPLSL